MQLFRIHNFLELLKHIINRTLYFLVATILQQNARNSIKKGRKKYDEYYSEDKWHDRVDRGFSDCSLEVAVTSEQRTTFSKTCMFPLLALPITMTLREAWPWPCLASMLAILFHLLRPWMFCHTNMIWGIIDKKVEEIEIRNKTSKGIRQIYILTAL